MHRVMPIRTIDEALAVHEQQNAQFAYKMVEHDIRRGDIAGAIWSQRHSRKTALMARFNLLKCLGYSHDDTWREAQCR